MAGVLVSMKPKMTPTMPAACAPHSDSSQSEPPKEKLVHASNLKSISRTHELQASLNAAIPPGTRARPFPQHFVPLRTPEGFAALKNAESVKGFHSVAPVFQGQGPLQCGPTSLTVALNSLKLIDPRSTERAHSLHFDKDNIVAVFRSLLRPAHPFFSVSLDEVGKLAEYYVKLTPSSRVCVSTVHTNETTCEKFRRQAASTLRNGGMVIVNFSRAHAGYTTSPFAGHMSPIVAYNKDNDSVLLMDVAIKSWEPVWIPVSSLFDAMDTVAKPRNPSKKDTSSKRGFILFERI